ncbi:hypothetical protein WA1_37540 [Scytonema hofmannii PCC 7110]|uniref:Bacteriocin n=1 Tax=Scytonema hofmannii PCC 7110 TaxID=128403 RepID=A0A139X027_9CYAN|nr:hypothetical protein [Scytonema hofmannii]KYC38061.1 hypothetical protein WA1_37540 [Scytonema hofmannii PCC 7110]
MANIEIQNLQLAGSELFQDSESFLNEMSDSEIWSVQGGLTLDTLVFSLPDTISDPLAGASVGTASGITSGLTSGTIGGLSLTGPV